MSEPAVARRNKELGLIHVGKRAIGMDDGAYRALIHWISDGRTQSSKDLTPEERRELIEELRRKGFKPAAKARSPRRAGPRRLAPGEQQGKIRALWLSVYHLGEIDDPSEAALAAWVKRQAGVDALEWLDPAAADTAIRGLRGWCKRVGFEQPTAAYEKLIRAARAQAGLPAVGAGFCAKVVLIETQWQRLNALGAFKAGGFASLETWLRREAGVAAPWFLEPEDADRCIEALGAWLRKAKARNQAQGESGLRPSTSAQDEEAQDEGG